MKEENIDVYDNQPDFVRTSSFKLGSHIAIGLANSMRNKPSNFVLYPAKRSSSYSGIFLSQARH